MGGSVGFLLTDTPFRDPYNSAVRPRTPMWKCPACSTLIHHNDVETAPRPDVVYRCPICRLELTINEHSDQFVLARREAPDKPAKR